MKKRIFAASPVSDNLQAEILEWEKGYSSLPVRWLEGKNLHITLVPPWYEDDIEHIKEILSSIREKFGGFEIAFERVTYGPDPKRPRLIWAEGETPKALVALKAKIEEALGIRPESRPFKLHLTIARFRPEDFSQFSIKKLDERVSWHDAVRSFTLMESRLSPGGADYEIIKAIPLGGA